jgi:tetratricopeptide (TPR) repeat protein
MNYRSTPYRLFTICAAILLIAGGIQAQSSRPRRVKSSQAKPAEDPLLRPEPTPSSTAKRNPNAPLLDVQPVKPVANSPAPANDTGTRPANNSAVASSSTAHAYQLLQEKQYAAAAKEAKELAASNPKDSEAWKIAGFAELNLKQYGPSATDLEKALQLQRAAKQEDPNTVDALAQAYVLSEKFDRALPLLVTATNRAGSKPDPLMLYYRGLAEYKSGKPLDAEKTFNAVIKVNPKDSLSLYYLSQIALAKNDLDGAIASLNRVTVTDPKMTAAWTLLVSAYLRRASLSEDPAKADADYLNAVRSGEGLIKLKTDAESVTLFGQALIGAKQFPRAAAALERAVQAPDANGVTYYLLGVAHSRANNFPKAITALQTAATKSPDDVNVYRELGYAYEVSKQYAKALAAYQKGATLAPGDTDFKESIERVKPFAK